MFIFAFVAIDFDVNEFFTYIFSFMVLGFNVPIWIHFELIFVSVISWAGSKLAGDTEASGRASEVPAPGARAGPAGVRQVAEQL